MAVTPIDVSPEAAGADRRAAAAALDAVAVRAAVTRMARLQDWGRHAERVENWCWAALGDALDELASVAPGRYGADAAGRHRALLDDLRADLGLPPAD
jgi:hypothetical protein